MKIISSDYIHKYIFTVKRDLHAVEKRLTSTSEKSQQAIDDLHRVTLQLPQSERRLYQEELGQQFKQVRQLLVYNFVR